MPASLLFWILCTLFVLVTLAVLLRALLRRRDVSGPAADDASVSIYRDQRRQLDDDLASGTIDAAEHRRMVDELALRLGREVTGSTSDGATAAADVGAASGTAGGGRARMVAIALVILVPLLSVALYALLGHPASLVTPTVQAGQPVTRDNVLAMIDTLARKMKENPADPKGWALLGRSYAALGRYDDAVRAYGEAVQRSPADATLLADYADVRAMASGSLQGEPSELLQRALAVDPKHPKALALAASAAAERGDIEASLALWHRLAAVLPPQGDEAREVAQAIAELEARQSAGAAGAASPNTATASRVAGDIALAPSLAARTSPGDTVFVFARAVDGPRMPLAVMKLAVRDLPHAFALDDSMAMAPGATISSAARLVVEARVSKSGNAAPASGDLVGRSSTVAPGTTNIHIVIDSVNP